MSLYIIPEATDLSQKSVKLKVYHKDGICAFRYANNLCDCERKAWKEGDGFRVSRNGKYILQIKTLTGNIISQKFTIAFLHSFPSFDGGTGTTDDPYLISTAAQLNSIRENLNACYRLTTDIDLGFEAWGIGWCPVGNCKGTVNSSGQWDGNICLDTVFTGQFDGSGHSISHMVCIYPDKHCIGLFSHLAGEIRNCSIDECFIHGNTNVGGIAGTLGGTIHRCSVSGRIDGVHLVGGIAGVIVCNDNMMSNTEVISQISESCFCGDIKLPEHWPISHNFTIDNQQLIPGKVGGISAACIPMNTAIKDCAVYANINHNGEIFGICGHQPHEISNCFATGKIKAEAPACVMGIGYACKAFEITGEQILYPLGVISCISAWEYAISHIKNKIAIESFLACIGIFEDVLDTFGWDSNCSICEMGISVDATKITLPNGPQNGRILSKDDISEQLLQKWGWDTDHIWIFDDSQSMPRLRSFSEKKCLYT